ncbi:hypothetical protein ACH4UX_21035 [Streptomyces althioticus]|uniref:hypothetical protein n=1 Tax=Actinomycetes TaxID=1760 RepID=UPI00193F9C0C|nr:hypothetical protein [Actinospica acidiphila]MCC9688975.1 hypothetical protein [Streptomyces sp. MNU103]GGQ62352.1 hypothetical protein GCM10010250_38140 [Streptomyces althioticus]GGT53597.1 hypothetical protein GCM10010243_34750 [Streptomyces matensis]
MNETVLPADYQRIMDMVRRADGPVMVMQVCGELGMSLELARSETLRAKLNRLAEKGWMRKLADRDVVIMSILFDRVAELASPLADAGEETVVIDTTNYYPHLNGRIEAVEKGQVESVRNAELLGRPVVKAWKAALAETRAPWACPRAPRAVSPSPSPPTPTRPGRWPCSS